MQGVLLTPKETIKTAGGLRAKQVGSTGEPGRWG